MVHVAALREVRCSRNAYRGNETAEGILQQAGSLRMDLMDSLMAMCDMPAPGGDIRTLVEWLNDHLDRLESLWDSHKEWLERRHVIRRARWEENRQRLERQYLLRRARQRQRTNPAYAPSAQLITSLFITNEDGFSVSTEDDEEAGDSLLRLRRTVSEEVPPSCICGQCGRDNPGDCFAR